MAYTYDRNITASTEYTLQDVFDLMLQDLRKVPAEKRNLIDVRELFEKASKRHLETVIQIERETLRDGKDAVIEMVEEWVQTGKPVRTRWASKIR